MTRDFFVSAGGVEKKLVLCYNKYIITHTFHHDLTRKGGRDMDIELTEKEYRRLLDLVYIGNWILNSGRGSDRFEDYDLLQEKLFALAPRHGMRALAENWQGHVFPSRAYTEGGIHEAIADYEDAVFFDILAEELARRDLGLEDSEPEDYTELQGRMDEYLDEFDKNGLAAVSVDL